MFLAAASSRRNVGQPTCLRCLLVPGSVWDRHPDVSEALCIRAEGIRISLVPNISGGPMCSATLLQHVRLFEVGLRIIGVTQELHVLVFFSFATCDSALTDCDFRRNFRSWEKWILCDQGELHHLFYSIQQVQFAAEATLQQMHRRTLRGGCTAIDVEIQ